jgi:hypothetical protein
VILEESKLASAKPWRLEVVEAKMAIIGRDVIERGSLGAAEEQDWG